MVVYCVYKASFTTAKGSRRVYVGMTGDAVRRERSLQQAGCYQPAWLKAGCQRFEFEVVADNIPTKAAALATEALLAAHQWRRSRLAVRGGPWVRPSLSAADLAELKSASACKTLEELLELPAAKGSGHLGEHLRNLVFTAARLSARASPAQPLPVPSRRDLEAVRRTKKKSSGKSLSGNQKRRNAGLVYGFDDFERAKWGARPGEARARHWQTFKPMRTVAKKKPAASPASRL